MQDHIFLYTGSFHGHFKPPVYNNISQLNIIKMKLQMNKNLSLFFPMCKEVEGKARGVVVGTGFI